MYVLNKYEEKDENTLEEGYCSGTEEDQDRDSYQDCQAPEYPQLFQVLDNLLIYTNDQFEIENTSERISLFNKLEAYASNFPLILKSCVESLYTYASAENRDRLTSQHMLIYRKT